MEAKFEEAAGNLQHMAEAMSTVIKGKDDFIKLLVTAFMAKGHVLIEDMPGLGKTTAAKALASLIEGAETGRIQCTPDLLPYDITGVDVYEGASGKFHFEKGPVFCDILLADEINRATPKTQSALLEAMAENQVTAGNAIYPLSPLFFVVATQNPVESDGAYPLPVAELDRFLFRLSVGYPEREIEYNIVKESPGEKVLPSLKAILTREAAEKTMHIAGEVFCDDKIIRLAVDIASATRSHHDILLGVSPRGSISLIKAAKVFALFHNRDYVTDEDIRTLVMPVFAHRIILINPQQNAGDLIKGLAENIAAAAFS
jgi:MoxR-like ATPase